MIKAHPPMWPSDEYRTVRIGPTVNVIELDGSVFSRTIAVMIVNSPRSENKEYTLEINHRGKLSLRGKMKP